MNAQDSAAMLALLHEVPVAPGDVVWVPPGGLHAIGAGVFLLELQQPEDLSILLEWEGFALDGVRDGHLGVGFETALSAVNLRARSVDEVREMIRTPAAAGTQLPAAADRYFRLERLVVTERAQLAAGFAILVVLEGGLLVAQSGTPGSVKLDRGFTVLISASAGVLQMHGSGVVLVCRPPQAEPD